MRHTRPHLDLVPPALPTLDGVRHHIVVTSRLRMHVAEAGVGEPVLLLHGWPQHWFAWRRILPLLAADHRVICPDLRGFGWTDAPRDGYGTAELVDDIVALLDAMGLDRVLVIGHEWGGRLGFHLCLRAPSRVRRFVALNSLHPYWSLRRLAPHAWRSWWTVFVETPLVGRMVLRRVPAFPMLLFRMGAGDEPARSDAADEGFVRALQEPARARAAERVQRAFAFREIVPTLLGRHRSTRLSVPTLMLNGTHDFALATGELGGYEPYTDDLRIELVAGGGHRLHEQRPELVAAAAREFFAEPAAPGRPATRSAPDRPSG